MEIILAGFYYFVIECLMCMYWNMLYEFYSIFIWKFVRDYYAVIKKSGVLKSCRHIALYNNRRDYAWSLLS